MITMITMITMTMIITMDHGDHFPYDACEFSEDDMVWYCETGQIHPAIEEGNHTMELTIEDLEVGTNYSLDISTSVCGDMDGCEYDYMTIEFNATAETMSETFHLETDNYTCDVNIDVHLYEMDYYWGHSYVAYDNFHFRGPCEQPPSPFTLTYDGMEYEMEYEYDTYDDCTDDGYGWECEVGHDYDNDGEIRPITMATTRPLPVRRLRVLRGRHALVLREYG